MPDKIKEMIKQIVQQFNPDKIILFGSFARGTATPDSDADLLILMPIRGSKRDKRLEIRMALSEINMPKDIFVETPEEFEQYKNIVGTIAYPAFKEGKIVYERAA